MSANVRPLHLPGRSALAQVSERAQAVLQAWVREWVPGERVFAEFSVVAQACTPLDPVTHAGIEYEPVSAASGCIWFAAGQAERATCARAVLGPDLAPALDAADEWVAAVAARAWQARNRALCQGVFGVQDTGESNAGLLAKEPTSTLPDRVLAFGSGAVQLTCEPVGLSALVEGTVWRTIAPTGRGPTPHLPLTPLEHAVSRARLRIEAMLGSVQLPLAQVLDLRCGDVLRLPHRLDREIGVLCEGKPLARGALGESQGRKSIQVTVNPS